MSLESITAGLLASYAQQGGINHVDGANLPSEESVNRLASDLMHLLFPGFFEQIPLTKSSVEALTLERLGSVLHRLTTEIEKALRSVSDPAPVDNARQHAMALLQTLPQIRTILQTDVEAAYTGDPAARSTDEIILSYPCVRAISLQRVAHVLYKRKVPHLPRMLTEYAHERTGADIHPGAEIGSHFFIDHCTGVVVGETTRIGNHVKIYQGVTLGARSFELDEHGNPVKGVKRHPDIEDHVTIYPGATILGGDTVIGAHSVIGSNVWMMKSVPPHSIVYYQGEATSVVRDLRQRSRSKARADGSKPVVPDDLDWVI